MVDSAALTALEGAGTEDGRWWIADHGAQVMAWQPEGADHPVIWSAPDALWESAEDDQDGAVIRGGIPVCFPWFGTGGVPQHGIARRQNWERTDEDWSNDGRTLTVTHWLLNASLEATQTTTFGPDQLELRLVMTNNGQTPRRVEAAHHTYYAVGDADQVRVQGLAGAPYWDANQDLITQFGDGDQPFAPYTDFVVTSAAALQITDPAWSRSILIEREGSPQVVVWNPRPSTDPGLGVTTERWAEFVCIETAVIREQALELAPGQTHELVTRIRLG